MGMLKKSIFVLFLAVSAISLYAATYQDVVYLKNGSIIKGMITEQVPNESLKIETKDGNVFVFKMSEVAKMTKEKVAEEETPAAKSKPEKNFALLINPLGFIQFGPQLDLEAKLMPDLYILGAFRMHSLGLLSYTITDDLTTAYAFGVGIRKFFREADGDAFYIGIQEQYGINNTGISDSGSGNWTGTSTYLASALDVGYRWRTADGFIFSLGVLAGLAPVLTDTWHYNDSPGTTYNNDLKTYLFGMLELEVGYEL